MITLRLLCPRFGSIEALLSFPTRRSSDLQNYLGLIKKLAMFQANGVHVYQVAGCEDVANLVGDLYNHRSEEHTSELQSRRDVVCRLLLEKKNRLDDVLIIHERDDHIAIAR